MNLVRVGVGSLWQGPAGITEVLGPRLHNGELFIQTLKDGEVTEVPLAALLATAAADTRSCSPVLVPTRDAELLAQLSRGDRDRVLEWQRHVLDVRDGRPERGPYDADASTQAERKRIKATDVGVSVDTVHRKVTAYQERGLTGLLHGNKRLPGQVVAQFQEPVVAVVQHVLERERGASRKSLLNQHAMVLVELRRRHLVSTREAPESQDGTRLPEAAELLSFPLFKQLRSALTQGDDPANDARTRQSKANRPVAGPVRHDAADYGDEIQIDSTPCDFRVWGPTGPQKVWALFGVDVSTKQPWIRLVLGPPRGIHVGLMLYDILDPEPITEYAALSAATAVPLRVGLNAWPVNALGGPPPTLPGCITLDHGTEAENSHFISLAAQLGIELMFARTMSPTDKAHVESLISTFADISQLFPGHKGNAVKNYPEREQTQGLATFSQACAAFRLWSAWAANQPHTGLPHGLAPKRYLTPNEALVASLAHGHQIRVAQDTNLLKRFLPSLLLTPHDDGVTSGKIRYWCDEIPYSTLIESACASGNHRQPLTFHCDPNDRSRIFWNRPGTFEWVTLHAKGAEQAVRPFEDIRTESLKNIPGQTWPSHTQRSLARADYYEAVRGIVDADNQLPQAPAPSRRRCASADQYVAITNGGWDLADKDALAVTPADLVDDEDETW